VKDISIYGRKKTQKGEKLKEMREEELQNADLSCERTYGPLQNLGAFY
jgi:hypothetical protein